MRKQSKIIFHQKSEYYEEEDTFKDELVPGKKKNTLITVFANKQHKRKNTPINMPVPQLLIPNEPILSEIEEPDYEISDQEDIPNIQNDRKGKPEYQVEPTVIPTDTTLKEQQKTKSSSKNPKVPNWTVKSNQRGKYQNQNLKFKL